MRLRGFLLAWLTMTSFWAQAETPSSGSDRPYTVDYYYRIKWGYKDEWMQLYKRSHWPIMALEMKQGHILDIKVHEPHNFAPEPYRWDVRISITYKNALERYNDTSERREKNVAQLFADRAQQEHDENRRRELLEALWDHAVKPIATADWLQSASR